MNEQQRHRRRPESKFRRFVRAYRFEIIWLAVVALGLFLLLERMSIRATIFRWLKIGIGAVFYGVSRVDNAILDFFTRTTLSDAIGYVLILGALVALVLRLRWRLVRMPSLTTIRCPQCGGEVRRVHRRPRDYLINLFVPVYRYRCSNHECRWEGLRVVAATRHKSSHGGA